MDYDSVLMCCCKRQIHHLQRKCNLLSSLVVFSLSWSQLRRWLLSLLPLFSKETFRSIVLSLFYLCSYIEEQYARGRMVSPHLSIYKIRWATLSSGCHRVCGLGLWCGRVFIIVFTGRFQSCWMCCSLRLQPSCIDGSHQIPPYYSLQW